MCVYACLSRLDILHLPSNNRYIRIWKKVWTKILEPILLSSRLLTSKITISFGKNRRNSLPYKNVFIPCLVNFYPQVKFTPGWESLICLQMMIIYVCVYAQLHTQIHVCLCEFFPGVFDVDSLCLAGDRSLLWRYLNNLAHIGISFQLTWTKNFRYILWRLASILLFALDFYIVFEHIQKNAESLITEWSDEHSTVPDNGSLPITCF